MTLYPPKRRRLPVRHDRSMNFFPSTNPVTPSETSKVLSRLELLPTEIVYIIVSNLPKQDRARFAHASRACHDFSLAFRLRNIAINSEGIRVFRDGGKYEKLRKYVKCARFAKPSEWDPSPVWSEGLTGNRSYRDPTIPALRTHTTSLSYFPNLTELHIAYKIPVEAEGTAFAAVYASISRQPFYSLLQKLEFSVDKTQDPAHYWEQSDRQLAYHRLEEEDKEFLGDQVSDEDINDHVKRLVIPAPSLKSAMISVAGIAKPWEALFKGEGHGLFYYYPFFRAPKLIRLLVDIKADDNGPGGFRNTADIDRLQELGGQVLR
ncbi:hypothetical protein TWF481_001327 [Arthrobotrys musiformis]|uniref:F-box domain-containing protein n=1 Tax=Arthrobotrys musiformis TaxID=47236 RepID=A0AAV9WQH8_9PEZI